MKQKLLLSASLLAALSASAQNQSVIFTGNDRHREPVQDRQIAKPDHSFMYAADAAAGKTTTGQTKRWYSYFETMDTFVANQQLGANLRVIPIWHDSTVRQRFTSGLGTINYSSVYQVIDPINFIYYNSTSTYPGGLHVRSSDAYTVDSIYIDALYERLANKAGIVDTLILSLTANTYQYFYPKATSAWAAAYIPSNKDTLWGPAVTDVDSVQRTAYIGANTKNPGVVWKVPLRIGDSAINGKAYFFKVGGPNGTAYNIPAGSRVAITATFKSGDTWVPNVDSFNQHNNWRPITANTGNNTQMPYNWYNYNDRNMSGLMFSWVPTRYTPSVAIEGFNTTQFGYEFHSMGVKVTCATCRNVSVPGAMELIANTTAYPNPANNTVSIPVAMKADAAVNVSITNTVGQVMMTQNLGKVAAGTSATASFSTAQLPTGIYFYTVEANGRRITERFSVAH